MCNVIKMLAWLDNCRSLRSYKSVDGSKYTLLAKSVRFPEHAYKSQGIVPVSRGSYWYPGPCESVNIKLFVSSLSVVCTSKLRSRL